MCRTCLVFCSLGAWLCALSNPNAGQINIRGLLKQKSIEIARKQKELEEQQQALLGAQEFFQQQIKRHNKLIQMRKSSEEKIRQFEERYRKERAILVAQENDQLNKAQAIAYVELKAVLKRHPSYEQFFNKPFSFVLGDTFMARFSKKKRQQFYAIYHKMDAQQRTEIFADSMHNPRTKAMGLLKMGKISLSKANDDEAKNLLALYKVAVTKYATQVAKILNSKEKDLDIQYQLNNAKKDYDFEVNKIVKEANKFLVVPDERQAFSLAIDHINKKYLSGYSSVADAIKKGDDNQIKNIVKNFSDTNHSFKEKEQIAFLIVQDFAFNQRQIHAIMKDYQEYNNFVDSDPMLSKVSASTKDFYKFFNLFRIVKETYDRDRAKRKG